MKCNQVRKRISRYVDDELDLNEKEAFSLHILDCKACRQEFEEILKVHRMVAGGRRFSAPYGFSARVLANLEEKELPVRRRFPGFSSVFLRTAQVAFALVVMTMGIVSGNLLLAERTPPDGQTVFESFSLDLFQAMPPDSIGGIYLEFMGGSQ